MSPKNSPESTVSADSYALQIDEDAFDELDEYGFGDDIFSETKTKNYDQNTYGRSSSRASSTSSRAQIVEKKKETAEIGIQCEIPIPVPKPESFDACTQCCNIGIHNIKF